MRRTFKMFLSLLLTLIMLIPASLGYADGENKSKITDAKNAVVRVFSEFDESCSTGSAFGIGKPGTEPEYFVTNAHVCADFRGKGEIAESVYILLDSKAVHLDYSLDDNGLVDNVDYSRMVECEIVNADSLSEYPDIAILKAKKPIEGRSCLPLHKSTDCLNDADTVYALGFPGSMDVLSISNKNEGYMPAEISEVTLTSGIVSKKTTSELLGNTDVILHSATIGSGNSGGPLVDESGAVVGINTYIFYSNNGQYASIYVDYATELLDDLGIEYADADKLLGTREIVLLSIIAATIILAVFLVLRFKNKSKSYVRKIESRELRIQGVAGEFNGKRFPLEGQVSFGFERDNSICFPTGTPGVSRHHCVVFRDGEKIYIKDAGSSYGTAINNNVKIEPEKLHSLKVGDTFYLGSADQAFMITYKGGKLHPEM